MLSLTAYPDSNPNSAQANSSRLLKNPKVVKRINQLLDEMQGDVEISNKEIVRELKRVAFNSKNDNAKLKALGMLGEITGLFGKELKTTNNVIMITVDDNSTPRIEEHNDVVGTNDFIVIHDEEEELNNNDDY